MFTQTDKDTSTAGSAETFIGPSVKLEGNFDADGDIVVEGILIGNITTRGDIRVGPQAVIEAQVAAKNANLSGKIKGNLHISNNLRLTSTAIVLGDIKTASLSVEEGAIISGKISMKRDGKGTKNEAPIIDEPKLKAQKLEQKD